MVIRKEELVGRLQNSGSTTTSHKAAAVRCAYLVLAKHTEGRALELLGSDGFALVILDYSMPDKTVAKMAGQFNTSCPQLPVLVLPGSTDNDGSYRLVELFLRNLGSGRTVLECVVEFPRSTNAA